MSVIGVHCKAVKCVFLLYLDEESSGLGGHERIYDPLALRP